MEGRAHIRMGADLPQPSVAMGLSVVETCGDMDAPSPMMSHQIFLYYQTLQRKLQKLMWEHAKIFQGIQPRF